MTLQTNKDSFQLEEVTLSQVVALCTNPTDNNNNNNNNNNSNNTLQEPSFATTEEYLRYLETHHRCPEVCAARTQRIVDNRSRAPRGWDGVFQSVAEGRRQEEQQRCEDSCWRLLRACPPAGALAAAEQHQKKQAQRQQQSHEESSRKWKKWLTLGLAREKKHDGGAVEHGRNSHYYKYYADSFSLQAITRCEHAAEDFSALLYEIANKPSKVSFQHRDPKTGNTAYEGEDAHKVNDEHPTNNNNNNNNEDMIFSNSFYGQQSGQQQHSAPSEVHRKVLQGAAQHQQQNNNNHNHRHNNNGEGLNTQSLDDEIMRRWSTGRKEKLAMEEKGLLRSDEEVYKLKHQQHLDFDNKYANINKNDNNNNNNNNQQQQQGGSGTVPKW